jgi:hypothetical protein
VEEIDGVVEEDNRGWIVVVAAEGSSGPESELKS